MSNVFKRVQFFWADTDKHVLNSGLKSHSSLTTPLDLLDCEILHGTEDGGKSLLMKTMLAFFLCLLGLVFRGLLIKVLADIKENHRDEKN